MLDALLPAEDQSRTRAPQGDAIFLMGAGDPLSPPQRLGLTGPSGVGKTTLIERLIGLRPALSGELGIGGVDVAEIAPRDRRALFAYAAQDVRLLDGSVRENLTLAGSAEEAAMWRALDDAGLGQRIRDEPLGLDAPIGSNGERLSGGERRRLNLARAYLRDAAWLVLDEPTEGLDAATEAHVLTALQARLAERGQGLILISHRASPMALCPRTVRIDGLETDGRVRLASAKRNAA